MKRFIMTMLILALCLSFAACGGTAQESSQTEEAVSISVEETAELYCEETVSVDVIYFKNLGGSIMAACYTDEDVAQMGGDYFVILLSESELLDMNGEPCTLEDIPRGSTLRVEWAGMVMESYPAQIAAEKVTVLSDVPAEDFPAEDEIPALFGGDKWWEPQPVLELPGLTLEYTTQDFSVAQFLQGGGSWNYEENGELKELEIDIDAALDTVFDDNNTIKKRGFDTIRLNVSPDADSMEVSAWVDGSEEPVAVTLSEDGTIDLLDGNSVIYEVVCKWTEEYSGVGRYVFRVTQE